MTVYRGKKDKTYRYDFWYRKQRYTGSTGQSKKRAAEDAERKIQEDVERQAAGLPPIAPPADLQSPKIQDWANVYVAHQERRGRKIAPLTRDLAVALKFFGALPARIERSEDEPYHDLTLAQVAADPMWVERFEQWMDARRVHIPVVSKGRVLHMRKTKRRIGASAKNHLRSAMSGIFKVALLPKHKAVTQVTTNPWTDVPRDSTKRRSTNVTIEQLRAWIRASAPHVKLALAIAALAPKLRVANVLSLQWGIEIHLKRSTIVVEEHKTMRGTGLPLVVPITPTLGMILAHAYVRRDTSSRSVIAYRGRRIKSLKTGLRNAARRAGLDYGLLVKRGVTFHTLRHYAATTLAALGVSDALKRDTMGWQDMSTARIYEELTASHQVGPLAQLAEATPLADLFVTSGPTNLPTTARPVAERHRNSA
jgi:integrase